MAVVVPVSRAGSNGSITSQGPRGFPLEKYREQTSFSITQEALKVSFLTEAIETSSQHSKRMISGLDSFSERLLHLEGIIRPVHNETVSLARAKTNIQKTIETLDGVQQFYDISKQLQKTIDQGPAYQLDRYLTAMRQINSAIEYFEDNNPDNTEKEELHNLYAKGLRALEAEFRSVMERHSALIPLNDVLAGKDAAIFPPEALRQLHEISAALVTASTTDEMIRVYAEHRCSVVTSSLSVAIESCIPMSGLACGGLSSSSSVGGGSGGGGSTGGRSARLSIGGLVTPTKRPVKRGGFFSRRDNGSSVGERKMSMTEIQLSEQEVDNRPGSYTRGSHALLHMNNALLVLLDREIILAKQILPEVIATVLKAVFKAVSDVYFSHADLILETGKRLVEEHKFFSSLFIFDVIGDLYSKIPKLRETMMEMNSMQIMSRFNALIQSLAELARRSLLVFKDDIDCETSKRVPEDGTVHELTSNSVNYVLAVSEYAETAGNMLRPEGILPSNDEGLEWFSVEGAKECLAQWIENTFSSLQSNITRKARMYDVLTLQSLFLLNNYDHILRTARSPLVADVLGERKPVVDEHFASLIYTQRQSYQDVTWEKVAASLSTNISRDAMSKKDRETIKDKYSYFNDELTRIQLEQKDYTIPNEGLRATIRQDNIDLILPLYREFDDTYRTSGFSSKNPQKYLKFTTSDVEHMLRSFFGTSM